LKVERCVGMQLQLKFTRRPAQPDVEAGGSPRPCFLFTTLKSSVDQRRNASDRTQLKERVLFGLLR